VIESNAEALARDFDRGFAEPARTATEDVERLLAIRVGGDAHAVRLRDVSGLVVDRTLVPLPSRTPGLLGIVGLRSGLAPVYSLAALLGYGPVAEPSRWILLVGAGPLYGLSFEAFDGHRQIPRAEISSGQADHSGASLSVPESVRIDGVRHGLVSVAALTDIIRASVANNDRTKER
jgi:chemotaxis signal transduction protein